MKDYIGWLKINWAKVGFILMIYAFIFLFVFIMRYDFVLFLILMNIPLYLLHETEEYIFPGGFAKFFNENIFKVKGPDGPLNTNFIFVVNVGIVWILLPIFGILASFNYCWGLWISYFSLFAGIAHIILAIKSHRKYNAGLVVSLLVNIPYGIATVWYFTNIGLIANPFFNVSLLIGFALNAMLPIAGVILFKRYKKAHTQ